MCEIKVKTEEDEQGNRELRSTESDHLENEISCDSNKQK